MTLRGIGVSAMSLLVLHYTVSCRCVDIAIRADIYICIYLVLVHTKGLALQEK